MTLELGDLYEPLSRIVDAQPFNLIVSNPPYIPSGQIPQLDRSVREYEPLGALDGGPDGLDLHRRILTGAGSRLLPGGRIYLEIAYDQGPAALELARQHDELEDIRIIRDLAGKDRVLVARKKS
jgi:release factor glutamine methyltransferase